MRFANRCDVANVCYSVRMTLKSMSGVTKITAWSSAVGPKGTMEIAWVKVGNVPLEKRSEINLTFASS